MPWHVLPTPPLWSHLHAPGQEVGAFPPPPFITQQFSHFRERLSEEGLLKHRLPGSTLGISDLRLWPGPQDLYSQVPSWPSCCWFHDYSLRTTAPGRIAFSSVLPWSAQLFDFDFHQEKDASLSSQESASFSKEGAALQAWVKRSTRGLRGSWERCLLSREESEELLRVYQ